MSLPLKIDRVIQALAILLGTALAVPSAWSASLTPGNLVITINERTGYVNAPAYIAEYTPGGVRVQVLADVPFPGGTTVPTTEQARDLVLGPANDLYLFNGTFDPYLARLNLSNSTWSQQTFAGWSIVSDDAYGGIARLGNYIYVGDMYTGGGEAAGIVRFDLSGGATQRFSIGIQPLDLSIGLDGTLYALDGAGSPRSTVYRYNPTTLASLGTITLPFPPADYRGVAGAADGSIFTVDSHGNISHFSSAGILLDSLAVPFEFFTDIDISLDGKIAIGTADSGTVVLTDINLDTYTKIDVVPVNDGDATFVTWVPAAVPEPASAVLIFGGAMLVFGSARRRRDGGSKVGS